MEDDGVVFASLKDGPAKESMEIKLERPIPRGRGGTDGEGGSDIQQRGNQMICNSPLASQTHVELPVCVLCGKGGKQLQDDSDDESEDEDNLLQDLERVMDTHSKCVSTAFTAAAATTATTGTLCACFPLLPRPLRLPAQATAHAMYAIIPYAVVITPCVVKSGYA